MPYVKLSNGNIVKVTDTSPLLRNNPVVSAPNVPDSVKEYYGVPYTPAPHPPKVVQNNTASQLAAAQAARQAYVNTLTVSTVPQIATIQRQAQSEYVRTGEWNPMYETQAEQIRQSLNPLYPGGEQGFTDGKYFLPGAGSTDELSGFFSGLFGGVKQGADAVNNPSINGTVLMVGAAALLLLLGRR